MLRTLTATEYLTPLREGGSLPAIVQADDGALYVMKFVGAGQGHRALIAELIAGEIGRVLGLRIPEIVFIQLDPLLARSEPDPEIRDLLKSSAGLNLGLRYLPNAFGYTPPLRPRPEPGLASSVVWFDAYVTNIDRTPRNTNILLWQRDLWFIDHGASLYFHHHWNDYLAQSRSPFALVKHHVLLPYANALQEADVVLRPLLTPEIVARIVGLIPDAWLGDEPRFAGPAEHRQAYLDYLLARLDASSIFVEEARDARAKLL